MIKAVRNNKELSEIPDLEQMLILKCANQLVVTDFEGLVWCINLDTVNIAKHFEKFTGRFVTYNAKEMFKFLMSYGLCHTRWCCVTLNAKLLAKGSETDDIKWDLGVVDYDGAVTAVQHLMEVVLQQIDLLDKHGMTEVAHLEWDAVAAFGLMEHWGAPVVPIEVNKMMIEYQNKREESAQEVQSLLPGEKINLESNDELLKKFADMKIKIKRPDGRTENIRATNKRVLSQIVGHQPLVVALRAYRTYADSLEKLQSIKHFIKDKKVHAKFNQIGAGTGRPSTQEPNLAGMPESLRKVFSVSNGQQIISVDYDQQELKIIAFLSQDPMLLKAFREGIDIHSVTAFALFGKLAGKDDPLRKIAKAVNFGLAYGEGEEALAINIGKSLKEAREVMQTHRGKFPKVYSTLHDLGQAGLKDGFAKSIMGRTRMLYKDNEGAIVRAAANMKIQGSAADMTKLAMGQIAKNYGKLPFYIWNAVYDDISVISGSRHQEVTNVVVGCMKQSMHKIIPGIPPSCSVTMSNHWE